MFQELVLQKYSEQVKDTQDVKCSYLEGEDETKSPVSNTFQDFVITSNSIIWTFYRNILAE